MPTPYAGNPVYIATITVMDDGDPDVAATYAVPTEQLADRTAYLKDAIDSGIGFEFTDAILHGDTTFPDGTIDATVDDVTILANNAISIGAVAGDAFFGGNSISMGATTTITVSATTDITITAGDDLTINVTDDFTLDVNGDAAIDIAGNLVFTGLDALDINGGRFLMDATHFELADDVTLGGGGGDTITVNANALALGNSGLTQTSGGTTSLAGTNVLTSTSDTEVEAGGVFRVNGKFRPRTANRSDADFTADGTTGYEHIFPDNPAANRDIDLNHTGAAIGQRVRFNAQNVVTGANDFVLSVGLRTWFLRNASGKTVAVEFVSDGSAWVVDEHHEGGDALRNG